MRQLELLQTTCKHYSQTVSQLAKAQDWSEEQVLGILKSRDRIQHLLQQIAVQPNTDEIPLSLWLTLTEADALLQEQAIRLADCPQLPIWRQSFNPPTHFWWWYPAEDSHHWLWGSLTLATVTLNLAITQDIATRFIVGAAWIGIWSSVGALVPIVITLLASGGVLTQMGQQLLSSLFSHRSSAQRNWPRLKFYLTAVLFAGLLSFHSVGLPALAQLYLQRGKTLYQDGDWASAEAHLRRAIKLKPEFPEAQFSLGVIYEEYQEHDQAQKEYLKAVKGGHLPAYNNLAHLYILESDHAKASPLLRLALKDLAPHQQGAELEYALRKNLGQVRLAQNRLPEAETELMEATRLSETMTPKRPGAYCLLAQVLEKQNAIPIQSPSTVSNNGQSNSLPSVEKAWEQCLAYANRPEHDVWEGMARKVLTNSTTSKDAANVRK
ncbi:tetratricopeptide repeat protein [Acaryochloris sp. IP29b_bin.148]|uniref:tetratricopeptide repeat protein n=1 Tax=Acaryochloris sp. IP29b_bin.148 TaxID=2969218 RepID=UPI002639393C|nr:tetratricopeptide repeat protein [Acaryochloris sp. IP29b_bin.148]